MIASATNKQGSAQTIHGKNTQTNVPARQWATQIWDHGRRLRQQMSLAAQSGTKETSKQTKQHKKKQKKQTSQAVSKQTTQKSDKKKISAKQCATQIRANTADGDYVRRLLWQFNCRLSHKRTTQTNKPAHSWANACSSASSINTANHFSTQANKQGIKTSM